MKKKHNRLNEHNNSETTVMLTDGNTVKLNNTVNNKSLTYNELLTEVQEKIFNNQKFMNDFETYWFGVKNRNGNWSEKVKSCLDVITTYLLRAPDSGIKNVVIH